MIKQYKSKTAISINVVLPSKKSIHIAFAAQSDGSSIFVTDNVNIQYALEHHYKFGKLFRLVEARDDKEEAESHNPETTDEKPEGKIRKVKMSDIAAAKDFLADTFGISRTSLRSEKSIMEAAKAHNIEFEIG